ncbi:site-specific integrase [bacterium]|nr:MAG: site-specific integrase [bacterium]
MGRKPTGWKLRPQRAPGRTITVRFWINGREFERSTGTSVESEAAREAARIYAYEVTHAPKRRARHGPGPELEELVAAWLVSLSSTHAANTVETWGMYASAHWLPHFGSLHNVNDLMCGQLMRSRLAKVQGDTVRKELSALRVFGRWLHENGFLSEKLEVPSVRKGALGTRFETRRRSAAVQLSPAECEAMIAALPEWSTSRKVKPFAIRARFLVGYETSLRPSTLDRLLTPEHYRRGSSTVTLTPGIDKNRFGREIPLSARARKALDAVLDRLPDVDGKPYAGPIFGWHNYRPHLAQAAKASLSKDRADVFCGAHLRSARITHWLEYTDNLPGVQYLAGHTQTNTTARYVRPSLRAALDVLKASRPAPRKRRASK